MALRRPIEAPGPRILLAENERLLAHQLEQLLDGHGYTVVATVTCGEEAVAMIEPLGPDLVLMDVRLADGMDSIEAAAVIRRRWGVPTVFVGGFGDEKNLARARAVEPFGLLSKPINAAELRMAIELALHKHQGERALHDRLLAAERLASVGMAAAGLGHEINNPLSYVLANVDFAVSELENMDDSRVALAIEALREARQGAERIGRIVRQIRTWARPENEQPERIDARRVLDSAAAMTFSEVRNRARLVKDYGPIPTVLVDEARLLQAFVVLFINAAQATPEGNPALHAIHVTTRTGPLGEALIEIRDGGPGLHAEELAAVFEPFRAAKPAGVGSGLGLASVKTILGSIGGSIHVESTPGAGSLFRITLPPAEPQDQAPLTPRTESTVRTARILVVDAEPGMVSAVRRALATGHHVTGVSSAHAALEGIAAGARYDVLLVASTLPDLGPRGFMVELMKSAPELAARVVFITGQSRGTAQDSDNEELALEAPRLEKPLDPRRLERLVNALLR